MSDQCLLQDRFAGGGGFTTAAIAASVCLIASAAQADVVIDMPPPPRAVSIASPAPATTTVTSTTGSLALARYVGARQQPRLYADDPYLYSGRYWNRPYWYGPHGFFGVFQSRWIVHSPIIIPCP